MSELNQEYENNTLPKEIWKHDLDNHNMPTTNKKESIIEHKSNFENINKPSIYIIKLKKEEDEQNEKEKPDIYFLNEREKNLESIKREALEIPYLENDMNKGVQHQNLSNIHQDLPNQKIVGQSLNKDFFSKLNAPNQNEDKEKSHNLNENYEKMNHKISSFEKMSEQHYKPKLENFSNIPHPTSPGVGIVKLKLNNFDDSLAQEFNHLGDIKLNAQNEIDDNICFCNISTNFNTNINPMLFFQEDTHSFEHHSDDPST